MGEMRSYGLLAGLAACGFHGSSVGIGIDAAPSPDTAALDAADGYVVAVLADNPIAYWRLDDASGATIAHDTMGLADGTYIGGCTRGVAGALTSDRAVLFDGTSCVVDVGDHAGLAFSGTTQFTVEAWVLPTPKAGQYQHIFTHESRAGAPINGYALLLHDTDHAEGERSANSNNIPTGDATIPRGIFTYLVTTYDGAMLTIYVNAAASRNVGIGAGIPTYAIHGYIGAADLQGSFFPGVIDELAIYDHALTPARIAAHYAARD